MRAARLVGQTGTTMVLVTPLPLVAGGTPDVKATTELQKESVFRQHQKDKLFTDRN
jgi:hypothetical protein